MDEDLLGRMVSNVPLIRNNSEPRPDGQEYFDPKRAIRNDDINIIFIFVLIKGSKYLWKRHANDQQQYQG